MARKSVLDKAKSSANLIEEMKHTGPGIPAKEELQKVDSVDLGDDVDGILEMDDIVMPIGCGLEFAEVDGIAIPQGKRLNRRSATITLQKRDRLKSILGPRKGMGNLLGELLSSSIISRYNKKIGKKLLRNSPEAYATFYKDDPGLSHVVKKANEDRRNKVFSETVQLSILVDYTVFDAFRQFCHDVRCPQHYVFDYLLETYLEKGKKS